MTCSRLHAVFVSFYGVGRDLTASFLMSHCYVLLHNGDVQTKKQYVRGTWLRDYFFHHMSMDIGQPHVSAAKTKRASGVVDA